MNDDDYYDPYQQKPSSSATRWLFFGLLVVLGAVGTVGVAMLAPADTTFIYMAFYIPMVAFGLYATYRWAQGRPIAPTNPSDDERILESMRKHALPVQRVFGSDTIRCDNCNNTFDYVNAIPVDVNVILCPFCDTRIHLT